MTNDNQLILQYMSHTKLRDLLWDENPKLHDLQALIRSISENGFRDPPTYDAKLDAIIEGNGRITALLTMKEQGLPAPRGVREEDGNWFVPVLTGVSSTTRDEAVRYAIDHNNLVLAGGDFDELDFTQLWDHNRLLGVATALRDVDQLPITMNSETLDTLRQIIDNDVPEMSKIENENEIPEDEFWPRVSIKIPPLDYNEYLEVLRAMEGENEVEQFVALVRIGGEWLKNA